MLIVSSMVFMTQIIFLFVYQILHLIALLDVLHSMPLCDLLVSLINGLIVIGDILIVYSFILILVKPIYLSIIFRLIIHEILTKRLFRKRSFFWRLNMFDFFCSFFPFWRHILHILLSSRFWHNSLDLRAKTIIQLRG